MKELEQRIIAQSADDLGGIAIKKLCQPDPNAADQQHHASEVRETSYMTGPPGEAKVGQEKHSSEK